MAKSARSSIRKTNRSRLKKKVFGPVEAARTKRLSERLAELASTPKAASTISNSTPMETDGAPTSPPAEPGSKENSGHTDDATMDVDDTKHASKATPLSRNQEKKRKVAKAAKIEKKRRRKTTNKVAFGKKPSAVRGTR